MSPDVKRTSLALSHARLHFAEDCLRWTINEASESVLDKAKILKMCDRIKEMERAVWDEMQKKGK